jgi:hypothetical protein
MGVFAAHRSQLIVLIFSLSFGLWFITPGNVWPTSVGWLNHGDMAFYQYMWQYFRETPILQWPITAVNSYGDGWGMVLGGGLVLPHLFFKIFSPVLPEQFQFFGLWSLANFGLQGMFAERLFARFNLGYLERILGAVSIVFAPVFLFRFGMTHPELAAQWLILAALLGYFSADNRRSLISIYCLCVGALLVQIYLFAMIFLIAMATLVKRYTLSERTRSQVFTLGIQSITLVVLSGSVAWILGILNYSGSARGLGFFRLNVLAFFNPGYGFSESFSRLRDEIPPLRTRTFFAQEGEGFAYLGFVGLCGVVALVLFSRKWSTRQNWEILAPLLIVAGFLFLVAVSNRIAIVRREIVLPLPQSFIEARQVFRAATRFSWVAYYLILVLGWVGLCRLLRQVRIAPLLLAGVVLMSGIDQWKGVTSVRATFQSGSSRQSSLQSAEWVAIGNSVTRMYFFPTFDVQVDEAEHSQAARYWLVASRYQDLVEFGAQHQLTTNFAYSPRPVTQQVEIANKWLQSALDNGTLPANSIIFFARESDWRKAQERISGDFLAKTLDGYFVIVTRGGE